MIKTKKTQTSSMPLAIGIGVGCSYGLSLLISAVLASMIEKGSFAPEYMGYGALGILMISSLIGAFAACGVYKNKRMLVSLSTASGYFLTLLCTTALFFGGQYHGVLVTGMVILGSGLISALVGAGKGHNRKTKHAKRFYG